MIVNFIVAGGLEIPAVESLLLYTAEFAVDRKGVFKRSVFGTGLSYQYLPVFFNQVCLDLGIVTFDKIMYADLSVYYFFPYLKYTFGTKGICFAGKSRTGFDRS